MRRHETTLWTLLKEAVGHFHYSGLDSIGTLKSWILKYSLNHAPTYTFHGRLSPSHWSRLPEMSY